MSEWAIPIKTSARIFVYTGAGALWHSPCPYFSLNPILPSLFTPLPPFSLYSFTSIFAVTLLINLYSFPASCLTPSLQSLLLLSHIWDYLKVCITVVYPRLHPYRCPHQMERETRKKRWVNAEREMGERQNRDEGEREKRPGVTWKERWAIFWKERGGDTER